MKNKKNNNIVFSIFMIMVLALIGVAFFIFQNKELMKKDERTNTIENVDMSGVGWTEISREIKKEDEMDVYVIAAVKDIFNKYMKFIYEENEEAILEINNQGNTYIEAKNAKKYEIDEIYGKEQNYSYTFFVSCNYSNNEYYYLVDMDTSNKAFRFEEIDEETFQSAKKGSVSEKYDYRVFVSKGNYNTFKFDYSY